MGNSRTVWAPDPRPRIGRYPFEPLVFPILPQARNLDELTRMYDLVCSTAKGNPVSVRRGSGESKSEISVDPILIKDQAAICPVSNAGEFCDAASRVSKAEKEWADGMRA